MIRALPLLLLLCSSSVFAQDSKSMPIKQFPTALITPLFELADKVELVAINASSEGAKESAKEVVGDNLAEFAIKNRQSLNKEEIKLISESVCAAIKAGDVSARCFRPRHALRIHHKKESVDLLLCFECGRLRVDFRGSSEYFAMAGGIDKVVKSLDPKAKQPEDPKAKQPESSSTKDIPSKDKDAAGSTR